jgi:2-polyprenyl-3-methyl-5-hydroxy-6-metoxy-1,4-benzoquinol methylase
MKGETFMLSRIDTSDNPLDDGFLPTQEWFVARILGHISGLVLDCGCGRGLWSKKLGEKRAEVVGLDLSLRRLELCRSEGNNRNLVREIGRAHV